MAYDMDDEDEQWLAKHNAKVGMHQIIHHWWVLISFHPGHLDV